MHAQRGNRKEPLSSVQSHCTLICGATSEQQSSDANGWRIVTFKNLGWWGPTTRRNIWADIYLSHMGRVLFLPQDRVTIGKQNSAVRSHRFCVRGYCRKWRFHSSYSPQVIRYLASILTDRFVKCICHNISCALDERSLHLKWNLFWPFSQPWRRTLTNGSDIKYVYIRGVAQTRTPRLRIAIIGRVTLNESQRRFATVGWAENRPVKHPTANDFFAVLRAVWIQFGCMHSELQKHDSVVEV